jgi:glycosyltransferase involved in cell wall biosynthesis
VIGYKPVIFTVAGLGSLYTSPKLKMRIIRFVLMPLMRFAFGGQGSFIIFQNPDDQRVMIDGKIITQEKSTVIRGSGVDLNEFPYCKYSRKGTPIVLFSSRLVKEKGIYDFIEAARILKKKNIYARFQVAGDVYLTNPNFISRKEIQKAHDEGIVEWLGQCKDMCAIISKAQMMVLPSYYGEGVPKILLEAASIGRPIVTCDTPGCREAVEHELNGLLVPPQNPQALSEAIELLLNDVDKGIKYGIEGRERVKKYFHVDKVVSSTLDVYDYSLKKKV